MATVLNPQFELVRALGTFSVGAGGCHSGSNRVRVTFLQFGCCLMVAEGW